MASRGDRADKAAKRKPALAHLTEWERETTLDI